MVDFEQSLNPDHTGLHSTRQSVICLTTDVCLTADPEVAISIPVWSHNFVETDHEKISMVIFLHSADLFKKDYCVNFIKVNQTKIQIIPTLNIMPDQEHQFDTRTLRG